MASIATLTVELLAKVDRLTTTLDRTRKQVKRQTDQMAKQSERNMQRMSRAFSAVAVAALTREVGRLADSWTRQQTLLRQVARENESVTLTQERLFRISQLTRTEQESTVLLYSRIVASTKDLNLTQEEQYRLTELINKTVAASGSNIQEATNAIRQFTQGLQSGNLSGEELRSVLEQLLPLAQAIADGMDAPIGALRQLGKEGKLNAEAVINAIFRMESEIDQKFEKVTLTIGQAFQQLDNSLGRLVGIFGDATSLSAGLAGAISALAGYIDLLATSAKDASAQLERMFATDNTSKMVENYIELDRALGAALDRRQELEGLISRARGAEREGVSVRQWASEIESLNERIEELRIKMRVSEQIMVEAGEAAAGAAPKVGELGEETGKTGEAMDEAATGADTYRAALQKVLDELDKKEPKLNAINGLLDQFDQMIRGPIVSTANLADDISILSVTVDENGESFVSLNALLEAFQAELIATPAAVEGVTGSVEVLQSTLATGFEDLQMWGGLLQNVFHGVEGNIAEVARGITDAVRGVDALNNSTTLLEGAVAGAQIGNSLSFVGAGALGPGNSRIIGSSVGGAIGSIFGPLGSIAGSLLGGALFGDYGEENTRIQLATGMNLNPGRYGRRTALGVTTEGTRITEATDYAAVLDSVANLHRIFAGIIGQSGGLATLESVRNALVPDTTRSNIHGTYENFSMGEILRDQFELIMGGFDERVRSLVGPIHTVEEGFDRLGAALTIIGAVDTDIFEEFKTLLEDSQRTVIESAQDAARTVSEQSRAFDDSTHSLMSLADSVSTLQSAAVAAFSAIEAASQRINEITSTTIENMQFRLLGLQDPSGNAQFNFLTTRAEQLAAGIGGMTDPDAILRNVDSINSLLNQAFNMVDDPQRAAELFEQFSGFLSDVDEASQAQLEIAREEVRSAYDEAIADVRDAIGAGMDRFDGAVGRMENSNSRIIDASNVFYTGAQVFAASAANFEVQVDIAPRQINGGG